MFSFHFANILALYKLGNVPRCKNNLKINKTLSKTSPIDLNLDESLEVDMLIPCQVIRPPWSDNRNRIN